MKYLGEEEGKDKQPKTEQEFLQGTYPMVGEEKQALKINASELEHIVLVPRGMSTEHPVTESLEKDLAKAYKELSEMKTTTKTLSEKVANFEELEKDLNKKLKEATDQLETINTSEVTGLVSQIVDSRIEHGLLKEEDKDKLTEDLAKLGTEQLQLLLADLKVLSKEKPGEPDPKAKDEVKELSEEEEKKRELRKGIFGHEEPIEDVLAKKSEGAR